MTTHKSESLADFFNTIGGEKKKLKEEKDKIIGDLSLDNLFSSMEEESRKIKKQKKQLKKDVEAFKKILFKEDNALIEFGDDFGFDGSIEDWG